MTMHSDPHLESERLQAFAEGELTGDAERSVRVHLETCARCRSEVEGWTLLFSELGALPDLGPSPRFVESVMAQVEVRNRTPLRARLLDGLRGLLPMGRRTAGWHHLSTAGIQGYLEGALEKRVSVQVDAHLEQCLPCRAQMADWEPVFAHLATLSHLEPSVAFADRVMDRVPVQAIASVAGRANPGWGRRLVAVGRRLLPTSPKGWTVAGGLVTAPAVGLTVAVATVVLHPLLSLQQVGAFLSWRATEAVAALWSWTLGLLTGSPVVYWLMESLVALGQTPGMAFAGLTALWTASLVSGWILYRYIIAPSLSTGHHA